MYPGKFLLIGGGAVARTSQEPFMSRLVKEAGGVDARITLLTAGSDEPHWANADYWNILTAMGVKHLFSPKLLSREAADDRSAAEVIAHSDAVYIAGGSQAKFMERIAGTASEAALLAMHRRGGLLAGTSSGASIFGNIMILTGGNLDRHLRPHMVETGKGFGWLGEGVSIDTHCSSRGRLPRNIGLLIQHPELQIIAIDEDTGLFINRKGIAEVFGYHAVYILDGSRSRPAGLRITDLCMHCLTAGNYYNMAIRKPL